MSQFTTGEIAKACGVTVRTIQYWDSRGILIPSALTEGGRRLYGEDDVRRCRIICFLRDIGLPIDAIGQLLREEDPGSVISLLLGQQRRVLEDEIGERRAKLERLTDLEKGLRNFGSVSVESIGDVAAVMENKKKLRAMHRRLLLAGIPVTALQWASILLWIFRGVWWPFAVWVIAAAVYGVWGTRCYLRNTAYICPQCHKVFRPSFREAFWARHTPNTRRLTCSECGHHGFCVETWGGEA